MAAGRQGAEAGSHGQARGEGRCQACTASGTAAGPARWQTQPGCHAGMPGGTHSWHPARQRALVSAEGSPPGCHGALAHRTVVLSVAQAAGSGPPMPPGSHDRLLAGQVVF